MNITNFTKVTSKIISELKTIVGDKWVIVDKDKLISYSHDEVTDPRYQHMPEIVVLPENKEQISQIIKMANRELIPVTPRGAGTGLSAGAAPMYGGIVLSVERLNKILEIDPDNMYMVVEPGVRTKDVQRAALDAGLLYAGDPCSGDNCFIGGNIATNAGGNKAVKYGTTRHQVYSIEIVTPTGEITVLGGLLHKCSSGYCLEQLVMGSEGTLGIITKAVLKLIPLPQHKLDLLAIFSHVDAAIGTVNKLLKAGINPTTLEYMDNEAINGCARYMKANYPHQKEGIYLIITIDGNSEDEIEDKVTKIDEICKENGAIECFVPDSKKIWDFRKAYGEANREQSYLHNAEDIVVPIKYLPQTIIELVKICKKHSAVNRTVCHAGDGNVHLVIMQGNIKAEEWSTKIDEILQDVFQFIYSIGGRMSGEHGIGSKRVKWMEKFADPVQLKIMQAIKKAMDPNLILNPGTIFKMP